jgi:hypothetical protein
LARQAARIADGRALPEVGDADFVGGSLLHVCWFVNKGERLQAISVKFLSGFTASPKKLAVAI